MHKFLTLTSTTALLLGAFLITGCSSSDDGATTTVPADDGGGGGTTTGGSTTFDGNTAPAAIDATNTEAIGKAAGESVQKADASTGLPGAIAINSPINMDQINDIVLSTANSLNIPAGIDVPGVCSSGSASMSDTAAPPTSGPYDMTITYNDCTVTNTNITVDGSAVIHYDDFSNPTTAFSITYNNFTVTDPVNGTQTINMSMACNGTGCSFNSDFAGSDGVTHRITNFNVSGDASSGFSGSATFFHGTYGEVTTSFSGITYGGSCGSIPNGGTITYNSTDGSSGTIIFAGDCSVSGSWSNSGGSGSF